MRWKFKPFLIFCIIVIILLNISNIRGYYALDDINNETTNYVIYKEDGEPLFERIGVEIGDEYLNKNFEKYKVVEINKENKTGVAKFIENLEKTKVKISDEPHFINSSSKKIALYCSHNDESYVVGDGMDSLYGAGGIHDIAKELKTGLSNWGIDVVFDETLHIPHDAYAYSRSVVTAKSLLNNEKPDAIFDIHRDGTSRKYYIANNNGKERCMVRIVVGKGNVNYKQNEEFALYIMSVANKLYPWLIKDIYYGKGHYNQNLTNKGLLFEMGSHMVEKSLVKASVAPLTDVINTALFNTTVNSESGELTINGNENKEEKLINNVLKEQEKKNNDSAIFKVVIMSGMVVAIGTLISFINKKI